MADADAKIFARIVLFADAEASRGKLSAMGWEERADSMPEGQLLGATEIEAISTLVFGRKKLRR